MSTIRVGRSLVLTSVLLASPAAAVGDDAWVTPKPSGAPSEDREVVFVDGSTPHLRSDGDRDVRGQLRLRLRVDAKSANPFCFRYSFTVAASKADPHPPLDTSPIREQLVQDQAKSLDPDGALVDQADRAIQALHGLPALSLKEMWDLCLTADGEPAEVRATQKKALDEAERQLAILSRAGAILEVIRARLDANPPKPVRPRLERALAQLESSRAAAMKSNSEALADVRLAHRLDWAVAHTHLEYTYGTGKLVEVKATRTPMKAGKEPDKDAAVELQAQPFSTLEPFRWDVGIGPAFTFGPARKYGAVYVSPTANVVAETSRQPNLDAILSLSYYWKAPRFLDQRVFEREFLCRPRPMIGFSLKDPYSSFYLGLQVDAPQFLDWSVGVNFHPRTELVSPGKGEPVGSNGPRTRTRVRPDLFVAVSTSSSIFEKLLK
jgi:hypothetical protein